MSNRFVCTVLLISYNHNNTIARAIESILEQETKYPFKIHAFDDGSADGTKEIIRAYTKQYPDMFFAYIAEENQGAQANYWNAFTSVDTPYCILLEGDDYYCNPQKFELQINALEAHLECSFCGHDTYLFSEGEDFREYEEGSKAMTAPILKTKDIFTYEDFVPIETGGYIPYGSARMIRTSALKLSEIKYKEAVLFDFSQFYFLLLQGDFYYIDLPMSIYVRTGLGVCSGKSPMAFLSDFLQGAIDFNRQTNSVIADKIYSDCMLQIGFRLQLFHNSERAILRTFRKKRQNTLSHQINIKRTVEENLYLCQDGLSKENFYYLCNGGLGHTMFVCAYKNKIQQVVGGEIVILVRPEHAFIPQMYGIQKYMQIDLYSANLQRLALLCPNPEKGRIYVTHPFTHPEAANYIRPVHGLYSTVRYLPWLLKFMGIQENPTFPAPTKKPRLSPELKEAVARFGDINQIVLFFPESNTLPCISHRIWKNKAQELAVEGLVVLSCVEEKKNTIAGTHFIECTAEDAVALGTYCHSVYTMRNGMADLLIFRGDALHVYYPSHAAFFIYSANQMYCRTDIQEKIVLELAAAAPPAPVSGPTRAYLFGRIPLPQWVYHFYLRHKSVLVGFKKLVKWH